MSSCVQELPEQLGSCRALETLKVDDNALTRLPATLGGLVSLRELVASQNDLEELPASVGLLRALHTLHLDDNLLTGSHSLSVKLDTYGRNIPK